MTREAILRGESFYAKGYRYCRNCSEWVHKDDTTNTKRSKGSGRFLLHKCGTIMALGPNSSTYRKRYNEWRGVKWIE